MKVKLSETGIICQKSSESRQNMLLSSPIKYPTFGFPCQHFQLLHLLTFLHHRQRLQISLRLGLQPNQKSLRFSPTVPTSNPAPILYPPGSSKNVHQFSFPQSRISSTSLLFLVSFILFSSNQPYPPDREKWPLKFAITILIPNKN